MKRNKKSLTLLASLLLAVCLTVGGTVAYLIANANPVTNVFNPSKVTTTVEEDRSGGVKSNVTIKNTGDTDAYIRAAIVVTWQNEAGEVYGALPKVGTDYSISLNLSSAGWIKGSDGFYYWKKSVAPTAETGVLITECKQLKACSDTNYSLNVEIIGSGVQSRGPSGANSPVMQAWGTANGGSVTSGGNMADLTIKTS